jgi:hypothetical protein
MLQHGGYSQQRGGRGPVAGYFFYFGLISSFWGRRPPHHSLDEFIRPLSNPPHQGYSGH